MHPDLLLDASSCTLCTAFMLGLGLHMRGHAETICTRALHRLACKSSSTSQTVNPKAKLPCTGALLPPSMQCMSHINHTAKFFLRASTASTLAIDGGALTVVEAGMLLMVCCLQVHARTFEATL